MDWTEDFVWLENPGSPECWTKPGLLMFFNLECPGCVSRGVPFMKRIYKDYGDQLHLVLIHTSFGHKHYSKDEVVPTLIHFAESFARLPFPVALDNDSSLAKAYQIEGTPHWFVFNEGKLIRSLFGSQDNAQQRLEYLMAELLE